MQAAALDTTAPGSGSDHDDDGVDLEDQSLVPGTPAATRSNLRRVSVRVAGVLLVLGVLGAVVLLRVGRITGGDTVSPDSALGDRTFAPLVHLPSAPPSAAQVAMRTNLTHIIAEQFDSLRLMFAKLVGVGGAVNRGTFADAIDALVHVAFLEGATELAEGEGGDGDRGMGHGDIDGAMDHGMGHHAGALPSESAPVRWAQTFAAACSRIQVPSTMLVDAVFTRLDLNHDGELSSHELDLADQLLARYTTQGGMGFVRLAFMVADLDQDMKVHRTKELRPLVLDSVRAYMRVMDQVVDAAVETVHKEKESMLQVAGLPAGDSWTLVHLLNIPTQLHPSAYQMAEVQYRQMARTVVLSVNTTSWIDDVQAAADAALAAGPVGVGVFTDAFVAWADSKATRLYNATTWAKGLSSVPVLPAQRVGLWPAPYLASIASAVAPVAAFRKAADTDLPPLASTVFTLLDRDSSGTVGAAELQPWVDVLKALLPTPADAAAIKAQIAAYQAAIAKFRLDPQHSPVPTLEPTELPDVDDSTSHLGRFLRAFFAAAAGPDGTALTHDAAALFLDQLASTVGTAAHAVLDIGVDTQLETLLDAFLAVLWPRQWSRNPDAITLEETAWAINRAVRPQTRPPSRPLADSGSPTRTGPSRP